MQEAGDPQQPRRAPNGSTVLRGTLAGLPPSADDTHYPFSIGLLHVVPGQALCQGWGIQKG